MWKASHGVLHSYRFVLRASWKVISLLVLIGFSWPRLRPTSTFCRKTLYETRLPQVLLHFAFLNDSAWWRWWRMFVAGGAFLPAVCLGLEQYSVRNLTRVAWFVNSFGCFITIKKIDVAQPRAQHRILIIDLIIVFSESPLEGICYPSGQLHADNATS